MLDRVGLVWKFCQQIHEKKPVTRYNTCCSLPFDDNTGILALRRGVFLST